MAKSNEDLLRLLWYGFDAGRQTLVNEWQNTSSSNGSTDESVKFLISTNGELKVAGGDTLDTEIL